MEPIETPTVWRLHIAQQEHVKVPDRCRFCVRNGIAGMGWGVTGISSASWAEYDEKAVEQYGTANHNVRRFYGDVKNGDLVWTRDIKDKYYLGRLLDNWCYVSDQNYDDADIHNIRPAEWFLAGDLSEVPGTVRNAFIRGQTLRAIRNETIIWFSMDLFNRLSGVPHYSVPNARVNLFSLLDPDACEDLLGIYLQRNGWILFPSTCKPETQNYEFTMRHSVTLRNGAAQVKQGQLELIVAEYEEFDGDVFLLQTEGRYIGAPRKSTTTLLKPDLLIEFCLSNLDMMPDPIRRWARLSVNADRQPETEPTSSAELFRA